MTQYTTPSPPLSRNPDPQDIRAGKYDGRLKSLADLVMSDAEAHIAMAEAEGRSMKASEQREFDKQLGTMNLIEARAKVVNAQDDRYDDEQRAIREGRERRSAELRMANPRAFGESSSHHGPEIGRQIAEGVDNVLAGRGATATVDLEIRNTATEGGDFGQGVPIEFGPVERTLRARSVVMGLPGIRMVPMTSDKLRFPRIGDATGEGVAENTTLTPTDADLDAITLTAKKYFVYSELSTELEEDFSADALDVIGQNMLNGLALKVDADLLDGDGAGGVVGIRNWPGVSTTSVAAVPTSFAKLKEVEYELDAANADLGSAAWLMHPRSWYTLGLIKTGIASDETTLLNPNPQTAARTLLGYSVRTSSQITLTEGGGAGSWVGLIDGSQLVVGVRRAPVLEISRDVGFDRDVIALRATCRYGFAVINPGAVSIATDVRAS